MSAHDDGEFGAAYWEDRYRNGGGGSRRDPSPSLLAEAADLSPGTALDAGCGWGADAMWLAGRGWRVTAADISPAALDQARRAAQAADPDAAARVNWQPADLTNWDPDSRFDLVTSHYVHVPGPQEELFARLASWVAPGGTLLIVGHGYTPGQGAHEPGGRHGALTHGDQPDAPADSARLRLAHVTAALPEPDWQITVAEPRTHLLQRSGGGPPAVLHDIVLKAHRVT
jgi:SAM-dependent methyltransferase